MLWRLHGLWIGLLARAFILAKRRFFFLRRALISRGCPVQTFFFCTVARQMSSKVEVNISGNSSKEQDVRRNDQSSFLRLLFISYNLAWVKSKDLKTENNYLQIGWCFCISKGRIFSFLFPLLHPKSLERSHASKTKSCPTSKGCFLLLFLNTNFKHQIDWDTRTTPTL